MFFETTVNAEYSTACVVMLGGLRCEHAMPTYTPVAAPPRPLTR